MKGNNQLAETLIALFGIWLIISPLPDFIATIFSLSSFDQHEGHNVIFTTQIVHVVTKLMCGLLLILSRKKLVNLLNLNIDSEANTQGLMSAAIFILGLFFLLNGSVSFAQFYATDQLQNISSPYLFWEGLSSVVGGFIVMISSAILVRVWGIFNRV